MLSQIEEIFLFSMVLLIMFGVGASISIDSFKEVLNIKKAWLIGFISQFLIMPAISLLIIFLFPLSNETSIGLIVIACSPGGSTSNVFTYFSKGHSALSVSMTIASTVSSLILMPSLIWLCLYNLSSQEIVIPYLNIMLALISVITPVGIGVLLRIKNPLLAKKAEKFSSFCGLLISGVMIFIWIPKFFGNITDDSSLSYLSILLLNCGGLFFGYLISTLCGLQSNIRRTIMFETGIQNAPLSFLIVTLSFSGEQVQSISWVPLTYGALSVGVSIIVTIIIRLKQRF